MEKENGYLFADDGSVVDCKLTLEEFIEQIPIPKEVVGKTFSIKEFEKVAGGLKDM